MTFRGSRPRSRPRSARWRRSTRRPPPRRFTVTPSSASTRHLARSRSRRLPRPQWCPSGEALLHRGGPRSDGFRAPILTAVPATRPPSVYRGNPFVVEAGLAWYGGEPFLYRWTRRRRSCGSRTAFRCNTSRRRGAISESVYQTNWRGYELAQPKERFARCAAGDRRASR